MRQNKKTIATFVLSIIVAGIVVIFLSGMVNYIPYPFQSQSLQGDQPLSNLPPPPSNQWTTTQNGRTTTTATSNQTTTTEGNTVESFTISGTAAPPANIIDFFQSEPKNLGAIVALVCIAGIILLARRRESS